MTMTANQLTPEQMAGQRLMVGFNGTKLNADLKYLIGTLKISGIILFKRNISEPEQVKTLCRSCMEYAKSCGQPPLFIAIDQEGGTVSRLSPPFTQFPGNSKMTSEADAAHFAKITASELTDIGINMNFAPVLDTAPKEIDSIMRDRSFGPDPQWVAKLGTLVIDTLQSKKIMAVGKHFPGIGRTTLDSHLDRPTFSTDIANLQSYDLIPFMAAVSHQVAGIMLSHILYDQIDPEWPASLSVEIASNLLRNTIKYKGLVMTDDLDMGAIKKHYDLKTVIHRILLANIDLALICHKGPDIETAFETILQKIRTDPFKPLAYTSTERILMYKKKYLF